MSETNDLLLVAPVNADAGDDADTSPVAVAMRGKVELPVPDADVYPGLMDAGKMKEVYRYWMCRSENCETVQEAAEKAGVCVETALYWAEKGDWIAQKRRLLKVRAQEQSVALESRRVAIRTEESMAQIDAAQTLRRKAVEMLEQGPRMVVDKKGNSFEADMSPMDLQMAAAALKSGADIIGRFMGVAEPKAGGEFSASGETADDDKPKAQPLVVVVQGGGLPPVRPAGGKIITV